MRILVLVGVFILGSSIGQALRCQNCNNAKSDEHCEAIGYVETCQNNQESCKIEIRIHDGQETPSITKRCKQEIACANNELQNKAADGISSQCNKDNTVCRCCCNTDLCNVKSLCGIKKKNEREGRNDKASQCRELAVPENGKKLCSGSTNVIGTLCDFTCNEGFELIGEAMIACQEINIGVTWTSVLPVCEKRDKRCENITNIDDGSLFCDGNAIGDQCLLLCNQGFRGPPQITCDWPDWNIENPQCLPIRCNQQNIPANGEKQCTNGNNLASVCKFTCEVGFWLDGSDSSECEDGEPWPNVYGKWTSDPPVCRVVTCVAQQFPENGMKTCTNGNKWKSVCNFSCDSGYKLEGNAISTCHDEDDVNNNEYGKWNSDPPTCKKIECKKLVDIANGKVVCSQNSVGIKCIHTCNKGYKLRGRKELKCLDGKGQYDGYDYPQPVCTKTRCNPIGPINDGKVNCSNSNFHGSVCKFTCRVGCWRKGAELSVCGKVENESWSDVKPTCEAVNCVTHKIIKNGNKQCTNGTRWNSECSFFCDVGYWLNGSNVSTCTHIGNQPGGEWTSERPICKAKRCNDQLVSPKYGTISCSQGRIHGSICRFSCKDGFELLGKDSAICNVPTNDIKFSKWSEQVPVCRQVKCKKHIAQEHGEIRCSNGNYYKSFCNHTCNTGYKLTSYPATECLGKAGKYGGWNRPQPMCKRVCGDVDNLPHGMVKCSDRNFEGSECQLNCTDVDYELHPTGMNTRTCMNDGTWSNEDLCCAWKCPPNAYMDMIIILDSSSSIGKENWEIMKAFISEFVGLFTWGNSFSRFAAFRYNKVVDEDTVIMWDNHDNATFFRNKLLSMPYDGSGTNTRDALKYGLKFITDLSRQDAIKVMLLVTDGISQTSVDSIARRLRNQDDVNVFVLPVLPARFQKMQDGEKKENFVKDMITQMEVIAGSRKNIMEEAYKATEDGFGALMEDELIKKMATFLCGNPCHHPAHNH